METIKNYLETMFARLPNTESVKKAKSELLQMMEDKYNEIISEGRSENEAVGIVISEFGNLDELADTLGLTEEVHSQHTKASSEVIRRNINQTEAAEYLHAKALSGLRIGIGVMLFILCVCPPILGDGFGWPEWTYVSMMFIFIACGVGILIYNGTLMKEWKFIEKEPCQIDMYTAQFLQQESRKYSSVHALRLTIGIILCVIFWLPSVIFSQNDLMENVAAAFMFIILSIGVFLIIYTSTISKSFTKLLIVNDINTVSGHYVKEQQPVYINEKVQVMMELFWPTITCIYLTWSFLTYRWAQTWIIWPIAGIIYSVLKANLSKKD